MRRFISPTKGSLDFPEMIAQIESFIAEEPQESYRVLAGADSQRSAACTAYVSAVIVHRVGRGARIFYSGEVVLGCWGTKARILHEAALSLSLAGELTEALVERMPGLKVEVHVDIGGSSQTRALIREVVGMIRGAGFEARIKPNAEAASCVADAYTRAVLAAALRTGLANRASARRVATA